jgi:hypothetical protein
MSVFGNCHTATGALGNWDRSHCRRRKMASKRYFTCNRSVDPRISSEEMRTTPGKGKVLAPPAEGILHFKSETTSCTGTRHSDCFKTTQSITRTRCVL